MVLKTRFEVCADHCNPALGGRPEERLDRPPGVSWLAGVLEAKGRVMACGGSYLEYCFDRVQEAGVELFNSTKRGDLGSGEGRVE